MKTLLTDTDKSVINLRLCILCSVWSTEGDVDNPAPHYRHTMHTKQTTDIRCTQNKLQIYDAHKTNSINTL